MRPAAASWIVIGILACASSASAAPRAAAGPPPPTMMLRADPPLPVPRPRFLGAEEQGPPAPPKPKPAASTPAPPPAPAMTPSAATDCPAQLKAAGVVFETVTLGPQPEALCVVTNPVKLTGLNPLNGLPVDLPDRPTLACTTALVFADYLRTLLVPLTRGLYGAAISSVGTGPGFECRTRDHIPGAKISAHGQGLAVDIAEINLANGRHLAIGAPKDETESAFDRAARAGGCGFFHTALGPGADSFHETHWHFDLQPRGSKGDSKICQ